MLHVPVLREECMEYLAIRPDGAYLDSTAGMGGHTLLIARRLTSGVVIAADRDQESLELARSNLAGAGGKEILDRVRFVRAAFSELPDALRSLELEQVDGLLADLGVSRYQLTEPERGFSLMSEGPVDMRMDRSRGETAGDIVNFTAEKALADLIYQFGEERRARRIARAIVRARPIRSTAHLASVIEEAAHRTGRLHPATQTFMALRLAVNNEQSELDSLLSSAPALVRSGGRIVIVSFMSLEDRKVKHRFQALAREGTGTMLTKHVVPPAADEVRANPASRSAKLRALEIN